MEEWLVLVLDLVSFFDLQDWMVVVDDFVWDGNLEWFFEFMWKNIMFILKES